MVVTAISFVLNVIAGICMMGPYVLFFVRNFTWNMRRLRTVFLVFGGAIFVGTFMDSVPLVWITEFGLLLLLNIYCCTNSRIYNVFMMIPAFFFYIILDIMPAYMVTQILNGTDSYIFGIEGMTVHGTIIDVILCILFIVSMITAKRKSLDLRLSGKETLGFCLYFLFIIFDSVILQVFLIALQEKERIIFGCSVLFFAVVVLGIYWSYLFTKRENHKLATVAGEARDFLDMQLKFAEESRTGEQELKRLRHDLRGHMQVLGELCDRKEYGKVDKYIEELSGNPGLAVNAPITGNVTADIVLSLKKSEAEKYHIGFVCEGEFTNLDKMRAVDICTIFTNVLNNALEASMQTEEAQINIQGISHRNYFTLIVSNKVSAPVSIKNNRIVTTKRNKHKHGIGLDSVQAVVKRYRGDCEMEYKDGWFIIKVMVLL